MQKARTKPVEVEFITFDDFVKYFYENSVDTKHKSINFKEWNVIRTNKGAFLFEKQKEFICYFTHNDIIILKDYELYIIDKKIFYSKYDIIK